jgi:murein DD-endopeptidase MepM/ murein hydrolase activator NlpD
MRNLLPKSLVVAVAVGVAVTFGQPVHAQADDPAEAKARADAVRAELEQATREYNAAQDELTTVTDELEAAQVELEAAAEDAEHARKLLRQQAVSAYQSGGLGTISTLLDEDSEEALQKIEVASVMAARQQREIQNASAVAAAYEGAIGRLQSARERRQELAAKAEAAVKTLNEKLEAAEEVYERAEAEEARRIEAQRAAARAAQVAAQAPAGGQGAQSEEPQTLESAPVAAGVACPVEGPYSYIDSWGAPRSGGRSHKGTDIMAAHGKAVYAYADGVISRATSGGLGGIAVYLQGDDGNQYYYAHLDSFSVGEGERVSAGQPIGVNGSTGNASASAPHVHFEVHPGGGTAVNPYPFVAKACG